MRAASAHQPLKDLRQFTRFRVSEVFRTVCWDNHADLAPEFLYDRMLEQSRAASAAADSRS